MQCRKLISYPGIVQAAGGSFKKTNTVHGVHPLVKVKFKDFSRSFFSKFKDLELGKIFENGTH